MSEVFTISRWKSPVRDLPAFEEAGVKLSIEPTDAGWIYGGPYGFKYTQIKAKYEERVLSIDGAVWMSDSPHNALTVKDDMDMCKAGSVVLGGLGMGIHLRYLLQRKDITEILVIENDARVMAKMAEFVPKDARVKFILDDFYRFAEQSEMKYDNYYWDCFVGGSGYGLAVEAALYLSTMRLFFIRDCNLIFHGAPSLNVIS